MTIENTNGNSSNSPTINADINRRPARHRRNHRPDLQLKAPAIDKPQPNSKKRQAKSFLLWQTAAFLLLGYGLNPMATHPTIPAITPAHHHPTLTPTS